MRGPRCLYSLAVDDSGGAPVELHVVSDSTGETATRVVAAVEAQFPEQEFVEVRHPRVETVADLQLALARMEGGHAVLIFTLVEPTLRASMRELCEQRGVEYCDLLAQPLEARGEGLRARRPRCGRGPGRRSTRATSSGSPRSSTRSRTTTGWR